MPTITASQIDAVRARAFAYRRQVAIAAGEPAGNLAERIDVLPDRVTPVLGSDGWFFVGTVHDHVVNQELRVLWQPATNRARIGRPVEPSPEPEYVSSMPALSFHYYGVRDYRADPDYRYFLDGREYTPEETARIVSERNSVTGWTWERRADGPRPGR